jgi:hypothetical protein
VTSVLTSTRRHPGRHVGCWNPATCGLILVPRHGTCLPPLHVPACMRHFRLCKLAVCVGVQLCAGMHGCVSGTWLAEWVCLCGVTHSRPNMSSRRAESAGLAASVCCSRPPACRLSYGGGSPAPPKVLCYKPQILGDFQA